LDEVELPDDAGFPLWLVIVLMLAALSLIVVTLIIVLAVYRHFTAAPVTAARGSSFVKMEAGNGRWNLPSPERRVWTSRPSLPPVPHTVIDVPLVSPSFLDKGRKSRLHICLI